MTRRGLPGFRTFLASFLVLFLETALIRWMPAYVRLLAYFSNFILLASFLGIGVGCLLAHVAAPAVRLVSAVQLAVSSPSICCGSKSRCRARRQIYFSSGTAAAGRAGREHAAAAAAVRDRRGAVRDGRAADGARAVGAAAAARPT